MLSCNLPKAGWVIPSPGNFQKVRSFYKAKLVMQVSRVGGCLDDTGSDICGFTVSGTVSQGGFTSLSQVDFHLVE